MTRENGPAQAPGSVGDDGFGPGSYPGPAVMWEAKAAPGRGPELLAYALEHAAPEAQVYRSRDDRVVVIDPTGKGLPDAPAELMARPPHAWPFERIR